MNPIDFDQMPNFWIIGAAKCGTTTLFDIARQHPQVYVPQKKAADFFSDYYDKGLDWYANTVFSGARSYPARGEASPSYLGHAAQQVAERILEVYGERPVKLIATFRNPVSRAYSEYQHWYRLMLEDLSFEDAILAEQAWFHTHPSIPVMPLEQRRYLYYGHYAQFLKPFLACFPRESFLFLLTEDLGKDFKGTARKIYEFIGVDPDFAVQRVVANEAEQFRFRRLAKSLRQSGDPFRRVARSLLQIFPASLRMRWKADLIQANKAAKGYVPLDAVLRRQLNPLYREEIAELGEMIGRDLSHWCKA